MTFSKAKQHERRLVLLELLILRHLIDRAVGRRLPTHPDKRLWWAKERRYHSGRPPDLDALYREAFERWEAVRADRKVASSPLHIGARK